MQHCGNARRPYSFHLEDQKKKNGEKNDSQKAVLNKEIKEIQEPMTFLQQSSELLNTELVKQAENSQDDPSLISRANALKRKSEE